MGVITAPVAGSGGWPAWIARVANFAPSPLGEGRGEGGATVSLPIPLGEGRGEGGATVSLPIPLGEGRGEGKSTPPPSAQSRTPTCPAAREIAEAGSLRAIGAARPARRR